MGVQLPSYNDKYSMDRKRSKGQKRSKEVRKGDLEYSLKMPLKLEARNVKK